MTDEISTEVLNLLINKSIISSLDVTYLGQGEAHRNFLAKRHQESVVIRIKRDDTPNNPGFSNERTQLLFLEFNNIDFAPRSIFYEPEKEIHVISFIEGVDCSFIDLDASQAEIFVSQIARLEELNYEVYTKFCSDNHLPVSEPPTLQQRIKLNYDDRLTIISSYSEQLPEFIKERLKWSEEKWSIFLDLVNKTHSNVHYIHGDLRYNNGTSNLRIDSAGKLFFIDWESARFVNDCFIEVGDIIASSPEPAVNSQRLKALFDLQMAHSKTSENKTEVLNGIKASVWFSIICNPLWMIERYALLDNTNEVLLTEYINKINDYLVVADQYLELDFLR